MQVLTLPAFNDNYIWLLVESTATVVVDPGDAQPVIAALDELQKPLSAILVTHHHWDHVDGIAELVEKYQCPVYGNTRVSADYLLQGGETLDIAGLLQKVQVLSVPGHTSDHLAYLIGERLFSGDTLFSAGCGKLFDGTAQQLLNSLEQICALPEQTLIYPTHEYTQNNLRFAKAVEPDNVWVDQRIEQALQLRGQGLTTLPVRLVDEKRYNPFLRSRENSVKVAIENHIGRSLNQDVDFFAELRRWKDNF
ncbi:hydroxyacylglutathione hydrolase [Pelagibaculum spongiae]|uniref:hydroxyacylglutathione hydrolase n=1 Tax=Pelagibaculum spongiae TaxID=2080658 RepID=UPI001F4D5444|nr:hydroxyacylglutathione hydrolase [Pelagibaculum spongiae]